MLTIFLITALFGFVKGFDSSGDCERQHVDYGSINGDANEDKSLLNFQTTMAADVWFD